jgi:hypothetical protein
MKRIDSLLILVIVNASTLLGVYFLHWSVVSILFLYWSENIAVGLFNVLKMLKTKESQEKLQVSLNGKPINQLVKKQLINFFVIHYFSFTLAHGFFLCSLLIFAFGENLDLTVLIFGLVGFIFSHGMSYFVNFIGKEEYLKISTQRLFSQPYKRIIVLHFVTLGLGALFIQYDNWELSSAILLVALKTIADGYAHVREHTKLH